MGTKLLEFAIREAENEEILVGTWRGAEWALDFYRKNEFQLVENSGKLLREHRDVPDRQVEESVVLRRIPET